MHTPSGKIVTAIEVGTSKIAVLIGEYVEGRGISVKGMGQAPSRRCVIKGEITDLEGAGNILNKVLDDANQMAEGALARNVLTVMSVTGCGISAEIGTGTVVIDNDEHVVTQEDVERANNDAGILNMAYDREIINKNPGYYCIDGRQVYNPLQQKGKRLEASSLIVHGVSGRVANFRSVVKDFVEDDALELVFSPWADDYGILTEEEREEGVLLIDIGAGCTEYVLEHNRGTWATGLIQVGMEHVINDLAVGLGLANQQCRTMLEDGSLADILASGQEEVEICVGGSKRQLIPTESFRTIVETRLQEIFEIISQKLKLSHSDNVFVAGAVLTGGGAKFPVTEKMFHNVFDISCRIGRPLEVNGVSASLSDPRFSTLWGALKVAELFIRKDGDALNKNGGFADPLTRYWDGFWNGVGRLFKSYKI